ncbi:MAG TPA: hypothetical protein PLR13_11285 [Smithella sp.]|nr:hypothetical protein [Smithella sp.]
MFNIFDITHDDEPVFFNRHATDITFRINNITGFHHLYFSLKD